MKTGIKNPLVHSVLIAVLGLVLVDRVTAQTFTTLHSFSAISNSWPYGNSDGSEAFGGLVISGKTLYGTTQLGGSYGKGTVFALNTDGTGFTNLHSFTDIDGANLQAGLILLGNTLYGTAQGGGSSGNGTLFAVNVNGGGFTNLHIFTPIPFPDYTNSDGAYPFAGLILSGNTLYGTAWMGGVFGYGTVFAVNTDGTGFTTLHSFTALNNSDGANPIAGLILSGNTLYGTASYGGSADNGTVFAVSTYGTGFRTLHSFNSQSDGANPTASVILLGDTLYGTASNGGSSGSGTVFALNVNNGGFTNLHSFTAGANNGYNYFTNSDGANPYAGLITNPSGTTLYGTASGGGSYGKGTVFALNTDGTGFTNLHSFTDIDGANPQAGLILLGNTLYGTASSWGGSSIGSGSGTVFSLSFSPQLTITLSDTNVALSWPTNFVGFDYTGYILQSTTNLVAPVWTTNSPAPVVINGQNTVTNPISGAQQFFRLSQ